MSFWDDLTGKTAADAAKSAAADTYGKQQSAIGNLTNYGNDYASKFATLGQGYQPFVNTGLQANQGIQNLLADPSSFTSTPYYQSGLNQGSQAVQNSAVGGGNLFSGKTGKDLQKYGENYFDSKFNNYLGTLGGLSGQGQNALNSQNSTIGTGLQGQLGTRQSAYQGDMNAASTIGNGDINAANAQGQGAMNLANLGLNVGKSALGGIGGGGLSSLTGALGLGGGGGTAGVMQVGGQSFPKFS